jgi:hypothetical protein
MTVWGALAGGVVGTVLLTSGLRAAQELGLTRMDLPLLLGTVFTDHRSRASTIGYVVHFANGLLFALAYYGIFAAVGRAGWIFGAGLGLAHGIFAGGALVTILSDAEETPLLEAPGFLMANYGQRTALWSLLMHVVYGSIVGGFAAHLH